MIVDYEYIKRLSETFIDEQQNIGSPEQLKEWCASNDIDAQVISDMSISLQKTLAGIEEEKIHSLICNILYAVYLAGRRSMEEKMLLGA